MNSEQLKQLQCKLPEQPGLLGREDYLSTAVLMLLMLLDDEYHLVLEERRPEIRQGGEICFPGGAFDPKQDADTRQTAIRETVEELGIPEKRLLLVGTLGTLNTGLGALVDAYVGVCLCQGLDELRINDSEVKSVFTIPVSRFENAPLEEYRALVQVHPTCIDERSGQEQILFPARQLGLPKFYARPWGSGSYRILVYRMGPRMVWGVTARLINELIRIIRNA
jgi:coenzyme A diphosphatase NUDT7